MVLPPDRSLTPISIPPHRDTLSLMPVAPAWPGRSLSNCKVSEHRQQPYQGGTVTILHVVTTTEHPATPLHAQQPWLGVAARLSAQQHTTTPRRTPQQVLPLHNLSRGGNAHGTTPFSTPFWPRVQQDMCPHQYTTALACGGRTCRGGGGLGDKQGAWDKSHQE